jgi:hypothetical protein
MEAEKSEHEEREKGGWGLLRFVWIACVLLLLYALSIGPVMKVTWPWRSGSPLYRFYLPVVWLCGRVPAVDAALDWYVHRVWGVDKLR